MKNLSGNSESVLCEPIKGFSLQKKHVSQLSKKSNSTQKLHYSSTSTENSRQLYARIRVKPRPIMSAIFSLLIILLSNISHSAPQIKILQSPLSNKIEQPTITAIFKDQNGFLWIGTQHGLYKFDGVKILRFSSDLPGKTWIPVSYVMQISEDSIGRIIVATLGGGLLAWNFFSESFQILQESESTELAFVTELLITEADVAWAGTKAGLFRHDLSQASTTFSLSKEFEEIFRGSEISAIASDLKGNIYIASGLNIYKSSENLASLETVNWIESPNDYRDKITSLALSSNGRIFVGTDKGLLVSQDMAKNSDQVIIRLGEKSPISITTLLFHDDLLWIGTNHGLSYSDTALSFFETYLSENSNLSNSEVTTLFADNDLIWAGTYQGLNTISFVPFETFNNENSGVFNDVLAFTEDGNNDLWIGTFNGLYFFDNVTANHVHFLDLSTQGSISDHRIMTISSKGNELWVGFQQNGLQIIDTETRAVRKPSIDNLEEMEVTKILHTPDKTTWVATFNQGLYRLNNNRVRSYLSNGALPESSVINLFTPRDGGIFASSERKIYQHHEETDTFISLNFKFADAEETPLIFSISESPSGDIWIGTKDLGLFIWRKHDQTIGNFNLVRSRANVDFANSTVYEIQFDDDGNAWCSTQSGIVNLDSHGVFISRFNASDGLQGSDFNFGASFKDSAGRIYFGGSNGYNRFLPGDFTAENVPPRLALTQVSLSGKSILDSFNAINLRNIQLTHKDYFVQFDFSVLDFLDPEKNEYRYMLEGFDPVWIENGTRNSATYTSLPPGQYTLRVQGANSAGIWNREGLSLDIEVLPPPWQTWWAYLSYAALAIFLGWLGKRAYDSYVVERRATELAKGMVEAEERADDEMQEQLEIHDDLVKSVYRHSVSTLNLLGDVIDIKGSSLSEQGAREVTDGNIKRVAALALLEDCLYYQNELLLADLNKFTDTIISRLLHDSPVPEETVTTINEVPSRPLSFEQASPLAIAMYELLENAIQHAFEGAGPHYLHVILAHQTSAQPGSDYRLTIEDNGLGIPANIDPLSPHTPGLAIVASMVQRLSGEINYTIDEGTLVTITFHCRES
jgi:ligand-binding sensor domain-containing protein/two-component sensor histidine kinase